MLTADGSTVTCSGSRTIPLRFGTWSCSWTFQLAPVSVPILGADFLRHHDLSVSVSKKKMFSDSSVNGCKIDLSTSHPSSTSPFQAAFLSTPQCVSDLLKEFPDVLQSDGFTASPPRHKVRHHILTNPGLPTFSKACRLDPAKLAIAKAEFSTTLLLPGPLFPTSLIFPQELVVQLFSPS